MEILVERDIYATQKNGKKQNISNVNGHIHTKIPQNVKDNTVNWKKFLKNDSFISDILLWSKIDSSFPKC